LIAQGKSLKAAQEEIGMVVEGAFTCVSAHGLGKEFHVPVPITDATYEVLYKGVSPKEAVLALMQRQIKEEHL
jgi:glycerol-3-phosphate dehydrogenase (NAD(P)+)